MSKNFGRFPVIVSTMMISSLLLAACSSGGDKSAPTTSTSPEAAKASATTAAAKKDPVKLKFTYWGSPDEKKAIENATKKFTEKYPWITVDTIQIPNADYNTKLTAMAASNDMPDTGYMTPDLGDTWSKEGRFVNLFDMLAKDGDTKKDDFLDYVWYKSNPENAWGISTAGETFGLFYRKDLLEKSGVGAPPTKAENAWTWDQFVENAKKLTIDKNGKNAADPAFDPKALSSMA